MPLNGHGDDCLQVDQEFVISLYGTDLVFTAEGEDLRVRNYRNGREQVWKCVRDEKNRYAFVNQATGRFLGRDKWINLGVSAPRHDDWECLTFTKLSTGGYELTVPVGDRELAQLRPVKCESDHGGPFMKVVGESTQVIGLHQYTPSPFQNFRWVIPGRLARSAAPHYRSDDLDQNMDGEAIECLVRQRITNVISLNTGCLPQEAVEQLRHRGISYDHIPVPDFHAPTLDQLHLLHDIYRGQHTTLIFCGFGHGRTGTAVSALQLFTHHSLSDADFRLNYVETPDQIRVLRNLRSIIHCDAVRQFPYLKMKK
ncbi:hypothetical protein GGS21DRAFT_163170 [Xylaria nigripes]|nr:hypothetical protein GGS21DRAFT_163170 [Xylaria nigripes]